MKVLFCSSEVAPFIKTGGLGDVAGALPKSLAKMGHDVRVIMPMYASIDKKYLRTAISRGAINVNLAWRNQYCGLYELTMDGVVYYFLDNLYYFDRQNIYGHFDDGERFAFFSKAILEVATLTDFYPDIIHCNDWQTALVPVFLDVFYRNVEGYKNTKTVLTIHNIKFQGQYDKFLSGDMLGLDENSQKLVEYNDCCNYLKGGIECSNMVTTVSDTYAHEITYPYYSFGLDTILHERSYKLRGIVNGIDTEVFNPKTDKALVENFTIRSIGRKAKNKKALCEMLNLPYNENTPMYAMITRLTDQKGMDLVCERLEEMLSADLQLVILGQGDWKYESLLSAMAEIYPTKLKVIINFSTDLASKIYASSDFFLMPSQFEPCGLSQMVAMRYGSIPIVRETGGLVDTVKPINPVKKTGTGFTFKTFNSYDMLDAVWRSFGAFFDKELIKQVQKNMAKEDFSWDSSAKKYLEIYNEITK